LTELRNRAREHFPSVLLTLLSIIQALAVELWWSSIRESDYLWSGGWDAWLGWAQYFVVLLGILEIWLVYTSMVMRFVWVPGFQDSIFPFLIGIMEFSMLELVGPDHVAAWMCVLGTIFVLMVVGSHQLFVQARQDPANARYFGSVRPASRDDFLIQAATVAGIFAMALLVYWTDSQGALAFGCIVVCAGILGYQIDDTRRFWERSMGPLD
jgi:hypothetical protein